jgi:hypothetical protein
MKTAILLTGHMRCWETVFPNFKTTFIDRYNPDIFISTWDNEGWYYPSSDKGFNDKCNPISSEILAPYNAKMIEVENFNNKEYLFTERSKQFTNHFHFPKNIISMLYRLHRGGTMMEEYKGITGTHYDLVIRMRPDLFFHQPMPDFDPNIFYTIDHKNHLNGGTGDMIQIGSWQNIIKFTKLFVYINEVYQSGGILCPHIITEEWIKLTNMPHKEIYLNKEIIHSPFGAYVSSDGKQPIKG